MDLQSCLSKPDWMRCGTFKKKLSPETSTSRNNNNNRITLMTREMPNSPFPPHLCLHKIHSAKISSLFYLLKGSRSLCSSDRSQNERSHHYSMILNHQAATDIHCGSLVVYDQLETIRKSLDCIARPAWRTYPEITGLDWIGLDWIGLDWIGLDWIDISGVRFRVKRSVSTSSIHKISNVISYQQHGWLTRLCWRQHCVVIYKQPDARS
jgi:hypothetical protein